MSTRAWYEYYVLDEATKRISLSMQFYKWGDAVPENALTELLFFKETREKIGGGFPVFLLDDMLKEQLGPAYRMLPVSFSTACYLFLVQRAWEELSWTKGIKYRDMPKKERPDYKYGYQLGRAMALHGFPDREEDDEFVDWANCFIAAGKYVRPWADYALKLNVLQWIQYLTQDTMELDMGSIAGFFSTDFDNSFIYRYFIFVPQRECHQPIEAIKLQVCDRAKRDLLSAGPVRKGLSEDLEEWYSEMRGELRQGFAEAGEQPYSLEEALKSYKMVPSAFWDESFVDE